ncbi:ketoacyl-ACP synthase III [uncultured Mucilaginibacter sp.]|uniref:ketoacyl-ACP synthase III n=1 Tax=uncultured Mucilaginibacter sp. TaxID=797541 RepID=UPI0025ED4CA1|nr:ketoacyl-ACP synthase III [uncultured Mucilaginibacter sp.]
MKAYINSISYYLPESTLTNQDLVKEFPEWSVEKVADKIGVRQRHIASGEETAGDMAVKAAQKLFVEHAIIPESIDFILFCTQSPDYFLPTTACIIQNKLGIPTTAGALDFNLGCSGYIYGLSLAKGLIFAGIAKNILLLTAETYSKYIHPLDKGNRSIFGDGASATLVSTEGFAEIGDFVLGTDGRGADNLIVRAGGARHPETENTVKADEGGALLSADHLYMNGSEIFNFTLRSVPPLVKETLTKNGLEMVDADLFVFHQANKYMLNSLRKLCAISQEAFYVDMEDLGNTVSSTIPIGLARVREKAIKGEKFNIVIIGFGVGYSWGGCVLKC